MSRRFMKWEERREGAASYFYNTEILFPDLWSGLMYSPYVTYTKTQEKFSRFEETFSQFPLHMN